MFKFSLFSLLFVVSTLFSQSTENVSTLEKISLHENNWQFKNVSENEWLPAKIPGTIHLDLLENGIIDDPYYRNNEIKQRWIEFEDWEYTTQINADKTLLANEHIELVFEGLDTYASVYLNDQLVLEADNMFRKWVIELKPLLKKGKNELRIVFHSPLNKNKEKVENSVYELPAANETVDLKVSPYTRKAAYQFGWDWGPRFVGCGIWRPVYLQTWNTIHIAGISYKTTQINDKQAAISLDFEIISSSNELLPIRLKLQNESFNFELKKGVNNIKRKLQINDFKKWNPTGYGDQNFEFINYSIHTKNELLAADKIKVAIRKIELINEPDSIGTSFYFKVNDVPFFAKGANYIPQDLFLTRVDSSKYEKLIQQAVDANFNMIRVWGGGIYENDYFYDLCDQYGLLVWQDFMFANSMYPADEAFKNNVKAEIEYNVKRLRNHPCIALWCGNNEIEVAWKNWGWQKTFNYSTQDEVEIWKTYVGIFHEMIPEQLGRLDPTRNYVTTSPLSNWGKLENFNHSSMHYWGVWHGREPFENFEKYVGRFVAEYGYQSFPSYETLKQALIEEDFDLESEVMKNRQKSYIGNGIIEKNIKKYAYQPDDFKTWIELSQLVQAHAMGFAIRQHRIKTPHCMGTLFWQLNDCWPGPSWSVIDYYGNPKTAYDDVRKYYQPIMASFKESKDLLNITVVSDKRKNVEIMAVLALKNEKGKAVFKKEYQCVLSRLSPHSVQLKLPRRTAKKRKKSGSDYYYEIKLSAEGETYFTDKYYPRKNTTVLFPDGNN